MSLVSFTSLLPINLNQFRNNHNLLVPKLKKACHPLRLANPVPSILDGSLSLLSYLHVLPSDSPKKWKQLIQISEEAEARLSEVPFHLIQAILAGEDCRFLFHCGVDPIGIGRAVVYYPNAGGGSTITQQLMKIVFLTSERKMSRKFVEGLLSLIVEKRMSKQKILYSYLSQMYWGHGTYGIESAAQYYFGKQPKFLTVGESALLAGILPAPELLSPFTSLRRGKSSQVKVLRRMVAAGFLDLDEALEVASKPLRLCIEVE